MPFWAEALAERVLDDPDTRAVSLQQTHTQNTLTVRLDSLLTGPSYTALRYSQEGTVTGEYPAIRLDANHLLIPTHTWLITEGNLGRAVPLYDPLPAGVHDIAVEFPRGYGLEQLAPVDMPFAEGTAQVQRSGGFVSGVLRVSADAQYLDRANILTFWDATGQFYAGQVDALQSESQGVELHFMVQVPPNAVLTHWRLDGYRLPDPIIFHLHLPD